MPVANGSRLGPYDVVAPLGSGGMGEVYRARDSKLGRDVAIKILPEAFANDPERVARFQREAHLLAALNHPNIAAIYGLDESGASKFLVLELVEGESLATRLKRGALPLAEALALAGQVAVALEAAHEKGIIHRDLKPGNIMLTADNQVKVLDFGLAKAMESEPRSDVAVSPTISFAATQAGLILGTAGYMSPEQAKGRPADKRSDVWAFGCVLYEMLAGKRAFEGEEATDTLAFIITKEPDWAALPANTPASIHTLLRRCLEKDRKRRLADVADAHLELEDAGRAPHADPMLDSRAARSPRSALAVGGWLVAAVVGVTTAGVTWMHLRTVPPAVEPVHFQIAAPQHTTTLGSPIVSPDGRRIAFTAQGQDGRTRVWVRALDSLEARPLAGTEDALNPVFWSPDSRFIGFAAGATTLKKVDAAGSPPITLCDRCGTTFGLLYRGGAWSRGGFIVYSTSGAGLWRIAESGGVPTRLFPAEQYATYPSFLPDGRHLVYTKTNWAIAVGSVDDAEAPNSAVLGASISGCSYVPSSDPEVGYILFLREGVLMAQVFDAGRLKVAGEAMPIAEHVPAVNPMMAFSASARVLAFRTSGSADDNSELLWFDRAGKQVGRLGPPSMYGNLAFSPDGRRLVIDRVESVTRHVWTADLGRGVFSRTIPGAANDIAGHLSSDGRVIFTSEGNLYMTLGSGVGQPELLLKSATVKHANDWSPDGRFLIFDDHHPTQQQDLWLLPVAGDRKPIPLVVTAADEAPGRFSPDGKWIAYSSDESGRREIYVRDFAPDRVPAVGSGKWLVSIAGGDKPHWRPDGQELYYLAPDGKLMAVPVKTSPTFEPGVPSALFEINFPYFSFFPYAVAADGRFLVNTVTEPASPSITVVMNWTAGLKK